MLNVSAFAKINLTLEVIGKRDDGYHQISSVMQTIGLADVLSFEQRDELKFVCRDFHGIRTDLLEKMIIKAAKLIRDETGYIGGALIQMKQMNIPRAAGLGSSSTDSAAVLKGLNELWSLGLSNDVLIALASRIGSDTPFFIRGGTALSEGRGEEITPLPSPSEYRIILIIPAITSISDKTEKMYGALSQSNFSNGKMTNALVYNLLHEKRMNSDMMYNTFENVARDFFPSLEEYRKQCLNAGIDRIYLAGSGPALFSVLSDGVEEAVILNQLKAAGIDAHLVNTL